MQSFSYGIGSELFNSNNHLKYKVSTLGIMRTFLADIKMVIKLCGVMVRTMV